SILSSSVRAAASPVLPLTRTARIPASTSRAAWAAVASAATPPSSSKRVASATAVPDQRGVTPPSCHAACVRLLWTVVWVARSGLRSWRYGQFSARFDRTVLIYGIVNLPSQTWAKTPGTVGQCTATTVNAGSGRARQVDQVCDVTWTADGTS